MTIPPTATGVARALSGAAAVLREAMAMSRARLVPALLIISLVVTMTALALLTVGRADAAQLQVAQSLESAGARQVTITDTASEGSLTPTVVGVIGRLSTVERAVGLGPPTDAGNVALGLGAGRATSWNVTGNVSDLATVTAGRAPLPGEAIVSASAMRTLRLARPLGAVVTTNGESSVPVVGQYEAMPPFEDYNGVLIASDDGPATTLVLVATDAADSVAAQNAALAIIAPADISTLSIHSPATIAELHAQIVGGLADYGRTLLISILATGSTLIAVVVLADSLVSRADLGRRRALGASRGTIVALVVARVVIASLIGVSIGVVGALIPLNIATQVPRSSFVIGLAILTMLTAAIAALPPALAAAFQDPIRILRRP